MTEHERSPNHQERSLGLADLPCSTEDNVLAWFWQEGLTTWGSAFVAFARLHPENMESMDVLRLFAESYIASYESMAACIKDQVIDLNWATALEAFRDIEGIPDDALTWNLNLLENLVRDVYEVETADGKVHLFGK
jgi:hypothetical protein